MMKILVLALLVGSAFAAPAMRTEIHHSSKGVATEVEFGDAPEEKKIFNVDNQVKADWEMHVSPAIYHSASLGMQGADVSFAAYLGGAIADLAGAADAKVMWESSTTNPIAMSEAQSSVNGDLTVVGFYTAEGYNTSGSIEVLSKGSLLYTYDLGGAGSDLGSIAVARDGKHFAVVANVDTSYIIPGHARVFCFSSESKTPLYTMDMPTAVFVAQVATTMSDDLHIAFSTGTSITVADCGKGEIRYSHERGYIATSLSMSYDGKRVASAFQYAQVFEQSADGSVVLAMNAPLSADSSEFWIGSQVAFSPDGKLAVASYDGRTAKQNKIDVWDNTLKNVTFSYKFKPVDDQPLQNVPSALAWTETGNQVVLGTWGDANKTTSEVTLVCLVCGKILMEYSTPGSVFAVAAGSTETGIRVVAGGKHVHANLMGSGGDIYAMEYIWQKGECSYKSGNEKRVEMDARLVVNPSEIERINSIPKLSWKAGVNVDLLGKTVGEMKKLLGARLNPAELAAAGIPTTRHIPTTDLLDDTPIPKSFSVGKAFPGCEGKIRDQGQCGSCWAESSSEALSDRACVAELQKGKNATFSDRSAEQLVACDSKNYGCSGGFLYFAWEYMIDSGLVSEDCFPYTSAGGQSGGCQTTCAATSHDSWAPVHIKNGTLGYYGSVEEIQRALMRGGSISVAFNVYSDFFQYKSGVYQRTPGSGFAGGHAVKLVGWGHDDASGLDYWEVANSWNTTWGIEGKFWIRRGVNECGIEYNSIWGDIAL